MEVYQVENISHFHLVEIYDKTVGEVFGGDTVDDDVLCATMHGKVVH